MVFADFLDAMLIGRIERGDANALRESVDALAKVIIGSQHTSEAPPDDAAAEPVPQSPQPS